MSKIKSYTVSKKLTIVMLVFFAILFVLILRLGFIQLIQGGDLKEKMYDQLITSRLVNPNRGTIYDSTGKALAISADVDTITINPKSIIVNTDGRLDEGATKALKEKVAKAFSDIFELDYEATLKKVSSENPYETIIRKVEKDKVDKLKTWMEEQKIYSGINIEEDTKRYYPYENLASTLLGFCGNDNQGLYGLELYWDNILTGTPGRVVTSQDATQGLIPDENQTYIPAENGYDLTLTIDANIQTIVEKYLKKACIENGCERGGNVIAMDPKTGDILAMATYPDFNLNTPFEMPSYLTEKEWKKMSSEEQTKTLYNVYRNRAISDTYEPGSVFKSITAAVALEENLASVDKANVYRCKGGEVVSGIRIACAHGKVHGYQSLRYALANSCNPSFIQLGQKIGANTLYKYYDAFGFFDKTNIETAGEENVSPIFWDIDNVGPLELATMSFGQRFKITPLQMITAVSSLANDGTLMKPRIVKEMKNTDTDAVTTIDPVQVRQVVSKQTASNVLDMLETVVTDGTGKYAKVKGYSIGGKTGTSEPDPGNKDEGYTYSFLAISPIENPEIVMLVTLYNPTKGNASAGVPIAAIAASQIFSEVLPYLQVPSDATGNSNSNTITLPDVTNRTVAEAKKKLEEAGFICSTSANSSDLVKEQYPFKGSQLMKGSIVKLYTETENTRVSKQVPDLMGKNLSQVKDLLKQKNLNLSYTGSGVVVSQDPIKDTSVEEGTVIKVTLGY